MLFKGLDQLDGQTNINYDKDWRILKKHENVTLLNLNILILILYCTFLYSSKTGSNTMLHCTHDFSVGMAENRF